MGIQPITVPPAVASALAKAGDKSGVDFDYLLETALRESDLDPNAKNPKSSALGLFQFLDQTWLGVMKEEGPRLGYGKYADAIVVRPDGSFDIPDKALKREVLKLRENPQVAADLAAAFTRDNGAYLLGQFGRMPSPGELYIAHVLGAQGAARLFRAGLENPDQKAAPIFPAEAAANHRIFYDSAGRPRSVRGVYEKLVGQVSGPMPEIHAGFAAQQISAAEPHAAVPGVPPGDREPLPSRIGREVSFTDLFTTGNAGASGSPVSPVVAGAQSALFADLYQGDH